jgi:hypothetical protein
VPLAERHPARINDQTMRAKREQAPRPGRTDSTPTGRTHPLRAVAALAPVALASLALGLATTFALAWYFGAFADWTDRHTVTSYLAPAQSKSSSVRVWQVEMPGALRRVIVTYGEAQWDHGKDYIPEEAWFDLRIGPDTRFDTSWGRLHDAVVLKTNVVQAVEDARGWPWLALSSWYNPDPPNPANLHGAIALDSALTPESPAKLLPYLPIWRGLFADTIVFAVPWALLLLAPALVRRRRRARRGACPKCGYDLRGNVGPRCPECGWSAAGQEGRDGARNSEALAPSAPAA